MDRIIVPVLAHRRKQLHGQAQTPNEIAQILSVVLCEKTTIEQVFSELREQVAKLAGHNRLRLFEF